MRDRSDRPALELSDLDRRIWDEELEAFVPDKVFDVHVHFALPEHDLTEPGGKTIGRPGEWEDEALTTVRRGDVDAIYERIFPKREVHYAGMGWPFGRLDFDGANAFVASEMADDPQSVAVMMVHPSFPAKKLAGDVDLHGFRGLKPYLCYAGDRNECRITDMLPEALIEVADEKELFVVLHVSKKLAIADEQNIRDLSDLTRRYPKVRWDLAHMGRSSVAWPLERAIGRLKDLPNLWFDFSSVTNADVFMVAFKDIAIERIMFGSDIPSDLRRGNMVSFGMGWALLREKEIAAMKIEYCDSRCTFLLYETLRALRRAAGLMGLGKREIEDLFFNNALKFVMGGT